MQEMLVDEIATCSPGALSMALPRGKEMHEASPTPNIVHTPTVFPVITFIFIKNTQI